ncbi:MAG: cadherin-like domain-containing protein, partial [Candidatus Accumulibacter sp.]|uniref:Ig-like domain-containing protein n=1 Tax=Accumulibacter sp. TaxID=2053492 RepID=UPI002879A931
VGQILRVVASYTDGQGTLESVPSAATGAVTNLNDAPTGSVTIDDTTPAQGQTLTASNTLADADGLGAISYQWQRTGVDIAGATGNTYTTTQADVGQILRVVASYTDSQGTLESIPSAATSAVTNVNDAPTGTDAIVATLEDSAYVFNPSDFGFRDTLDDPGNALANVRIATLPDVGNLTLAGTAVAAGQFVSAAAIGAGALQFTPFANAHGVAYASFSFQVQDDGGSVDGGVDLDPGARTITIDVIPVDDGAPLANSDSIRVAEGGSATSLLGGASSVTANDQGLSDSPISVSLLAGPAHAAGFVLIADGSFVYTHDGSENFVDSFTYRLSDDDGQSSEATVNIAITPVNDHDPLITSTANPSVAENTSMVVALSATDADLPRQTFTFSIAGGVDAARFEIVANQLRFTSAANFEQPGDADANGIYEVRVAVSDGAGGAATQAISVTVFDLSEPGISPVVDVDPQPEEIPEDALPGTAVGLTAFAEHHESVNMPRYSLAADGDGRFAVDPQTGVIRLVAANALDYEDTREYRIVVTAQMPDGESSSLEALVRVTDANDNAPTLLAQQPTVDVGGSVTMTPGLLAASDRDSVGANLRFMLANVQGGHFELATEPGISIASFSEGDLLAGSVRFVHQVSGSAPAFEVSVSDGRFTSAPVTVSVRLNPYLDTSSGTGSGTGSSTNPSGATGNSATKSTGTTASPAGATGGQADPAESTSTAQPFTETMVPPAMSLEAALLSQPWSTPLLDSPLLRTALPEITSAAAVASSDTSFAQVPERLLQQFQIETLRYTSMSGDRRGAAEDFTAARPAAPDQPNHTEPFEVGLDAARTVGVAFSVGAVWWALRVGGLMASLITAVPAWRQLDPLPILPDKAGPGRPGDWLDDDDAPAQAVGSYQPQLHSAEAVLG